MSKPWTHALNAARKFGGSPEDYIGIHDHMDSSKGCCADNRHRVLTHNSWYIAPNGPLELIFGKVITNSDGKDIPVRTIGEQHIMEDFGGYIPTVGDYMEGMNYQPWLNGRVPPPSAKHLRNPTGEKVDTD